MSPAVEHHDTAATDVQRTRTPSGSCFAIKDEFVFKGERSTERLCQLQPGLVQSLTKTCGSQC